MSTDQFEPNSRRPSLFQDLLPTDDLTILDRKFVQVHGVPTNRLQYIGVYHDEADIDIGYLLTTPGVGQPVEDTIVLLPGIIENPNRGASKQLHRFIAELNPNSKVISFATDGLSSHCPQPSMREAYDRKFEGMAAGRLRATERFGQNERVRIVGVSMGSVIATKFLIINSAQKRIDVKDVTYLAPGVMTPQAAREAMLRKLIPHVLWGATKQIVQHPIRSADRFGLRPELLHPRTWAALGGQVLQLINGVDYDTMDQVCEENTFGLIADTSDPLYQPDLWSSLQQAHPDTMRLRLTEGRGHLGIIDSRQAAEDIRSLSYELDSLGRSQTPPA